MRLKPSNKCVKCGCNSLSCSNIIHDNMYGVVCLGTCYKCGYKESFDDAVKRKLNKSIDKT